MNHAEIIKKLVGEINPIGESLIDKKRLENLFTLFHLVSELNQEIIYVATQFKGYHEHSIKEAEKQAINFLKNEVSVIQDYLKID